MKHIKTYEQNIGITFQEWLSSKNESPINTTAINCSCSNLIDLNGIEKFKNLKTLYCHDNKLTSLPDLTQLKNLECLSCFNNKLPYDDLDGYFKWLDQYIIDNPNSPEAINQNANKYNI